MQPFAGRWFESDHEVCRPIGTKFCTVIIPRPNFIMLVQNFGNLSFRKICLPKLKFVRTKKHPKFCTFYANFRIWPWIFLDPIEISSSGKWRYQPQSLPCWTKKIDELWSTNTRDHVANVFLLWVNSAQSAYANAFDFEPRDFATRRILTSEFSPQLDLGCWVDSHWALSQISSSC